MDLRDLMSGIGVVIDDAYDGTAAWGWTTRTGQADPIFEIVEADRAR